MAETEDEIDDSLLERLPSRVYMIESAKLDNQLQGALPDFLCLVHTPLAGKLCQLLVVSAQYYLVGLLGEVLSRLDVHALFDEEPESSYDGLLS